VRKERAMTKLLSCIKKMPLREKQKVQLFMLFFKMNYSLKTVLRRFVVRFRRARIAWTVLTCNGVVFTMGVERLPLGCGVSFVIFDESDEVIEAVDFNVDDRLIKDSYLWSRKKKGDAA
jgi:hypothetical protein